MAVDYRTQIIQAANRHGVPPEIALAVAQQESGIRQFESDGSVVSRYEPRLSESSLGIFQLLESTAQDLGVDPRNPSQNIDGGVRYLKKVYGWVGTGNWEDALQAYNGGIGNWQAGRVSTDAQRYAKQVLARAGAQGSGTQGGQVYAYSTPQELESSWLGWFPGGGTGPGAATGDVVYDSGTLFSTTVSENLSSTALLVVLGLGLLLAVQQAV